MKIIRNTVLSLTAAARINIGCAELAYDEHRFEVNT